MRPGILVKHTRPADRSAEQVRCDIAGIIGFIPEARWPRGAATGDFLDVPLHSTGDLWASSVRDHLDADTAAAVKRYFDNGGRKAWLYAVCVPEDVDLVSAKGLGAVLAPTLEHLRSNDEVAILVVPAAAALPWSMTRDGAVQAEAEGLYDLLLAHCREMTNRFLVMDAPRGLHGAPLARWVRDFRRRAPQSRAWGALYYPWLVDRDGPHAPSAAIAGVYARSDAAHPPYGVGWPPANQVVRGVSHTEVELTWTEAGQLTEAHINPIVVQPGQGVLVFGARTLSLDPAYAQINSRRVVNLVSETLRRETEWAVFETNNPHVWEVLERDLRHKLDQFWSGGLLQGEGPDRRYLVKCDAETNPLAMREQGRLNVEVKLHPVGTAEQIVIDLSIGDSTGGAA